MTRKDKEKKGKSKKLSPGEDTDESGTLCKVSRSQIKEIFGRQTNYLVSNEIVRKRMVASSVYRLKGRR